MDHSTHTNSSTAPLRVLIADRDPDARVLYGDTFRRLGCDVIEAADGRQALVEALVRTPSAIVIDTRLAIVNGRALCEILRSDSMTRSVPIIALTPQELPTEGDSLRRAGASAVLVMPVEPDAIVSELRRLTTSNGATPLTGAASPVARAAASDRARTRTPMSKAYERFTTTAPPLAIPALRCPTCDAALKYLHSHIGGVSTRHPEQWDRFECPVCGEFEYRHRTRKLRGPAKSDRST